MDISFRFWQIACGEQYRPSQIADGNRKSRQAIDVGDGLALWAIADGNKQSFSVAMAVGSGQSWWAQRCGQSVWQYTADLLELLLQLRGHFQPMHERDEDVDGLALERVRHAHLNIGCWRSGREGRNDVGIWRGGSGRQ